MSTHSQAMAIDAAVGAVSSGPQRQHLAAASGGDASPPCPAAPSAANSGLLEQLQALQWVGGAGEGAPGPAQPQGSKPPLHPSMEMPPAEVSPVQPVLPVLQHLRSLSHAQHFTPLGAAAAARGRDPAVDAQQAQQEAAAGPAQLERAGTGAAVGCTSGGRREQAGGSAPASPSGDGSPTVTETVLGTPSPQQPANCGPAQQHQQQRPGLPQQHKPHPPPPVSTQPHLQSSPQPPQPAPTLCLASGGEGPALQATAVVPVHPLQQQQATVVVAAAPAAGPSPHPASAAATQRPPGAAGTDHQPPTPGSEAGSTSPGGDAGSQVVDSGRGVFEGLVAILDPELPEGEAARWGLATCTVVGGVRKVVGGSPGVIEEGSVVLVGKESKAAVVRLARCLPALCSCRVAQALQQGGGRVASGTRLGQGATHVVCEPVAALRWLSMGESSCQQSVHGLLHAGLRVGDELLDFKHKAQRHAAALSALRSPGRQASAPKSLYPRCYGRCTLQGWESCPRSGCCGRSRQAASSAASPSPWTPRVTCPIQARAPGQRRALQHQVRVLACCWRQWQLLQLPFVYVGKLAMRTC